MNFGHKMVKFVGCPFPAPISCESVEIFGVGFSGAIHTSKSVEYFAGFSATATTMVE